MRVLATILMLSFAASAQQSATAPSANVGKYRVGVGVKAARCDYAPDPQYTQDAKDANIKGTVILSATVGVDGCMRDIHVVRPLGYGLDNSAVDAVSRWHCKPIIKNEQPTQTNIYLELNFDPKFTLQEPKSDASPCAEHRSQAVMPSR
jgi:TonB family protein